MKLLGDIAELKFSVKALENGYNVLQPFGEVSYDFAVEKNGKFSRIQVKSCNLPMSETGRFPVGVSKGNKAKAKYTKEDCDYIAIYLKALDMFYIIPVRFITVVKVGLYPMDTTSRYYAFKENWSI